MVVFSVGSTSSTFQSSLLFCTTISAGAGGWFSVGSTSSTFQSSLLFCTTLLAGGGGWFSVGNNIVIEKS